jgi:hypothetical protein
LNFYNLIIILLNYKKYLKVYNYLKRVIYILLILGFSCIDKYAFESAEPEGLLNVEGYLTTLPKQHVIRLSRADKFGPEFIGLNRPISTATVLIKDDVGNVEQLEHTESGLYLSRPDFAAEIGRKYNLEIELIDGSRYISSPEEVFEVPRLDSVTYNAIRIPSTDRLNDEIGVEIVGHFQDPENRQNYYFWNLLVSDFQFIAEPENNHNGPNHPTCPRCPNPLDCCRVCYRKEIPKPVNIITIDDTDFNGNYQRRRIAYIRDNGLRFKGIYRLDMQHLSVSQEAHRYLKLIGQQLNLTGSVFDPPPANIRGNFFNLDKIEEQVLGYFFVSDEVPIRVYIDRENLEHVVRPVTGFPTDCRAGRGASINPPLDWNP